MLQPPHLGLPAFAANADKHRIQKGLIDAVASSGVASERSTGGQTLAFPRCPTSVRYRSSRESWTAPMQSSRVGMAPQIRALAAE